MVHRCMPSLPNSSNIAPVFPPWHPFLHCGTYTTGLKIKFIKYDYAQNLLYPISTSASGVPAASGCAHIGRTHDSAFLLKKWHIPATKCLLKQVESRKKFFRLFLSVKMRISITFLVTRFTSHCQLAFWRACWYLETPCTKQRHCAVPALRLAFAYLKHGFLHSAMVAGWGGGEEGEENKLYSACTLSLFPLCWDLFLARDMHCRTCANHLRDAMLCIALRLSRRCTMVVVGGRGRKNVCQLKTQYLHYVISLGTANRRT